MIGFRAWIILSMAVAAGAAGCSDTTRDSMQQDMKRSVRAVVQEGQEELTALKARMDEIERRLQTTGQKARERYQQTLDALQRRRNALRKQLDEVKEQTGETGEQARRRIQQALDDLEAEYNRILEELKTH